MTKTESDLPQFYRQSKEVLVKRIAKVLKYNKHLAEDIVQDAFLRAFVYLHTYDPERASLKVWFNKVLYNVLREYQDKYANILQEVHLESPLLAEKEDFYEEIMQVPLEKHREVLIYFYLFGYTSSQIAELVEGVSQTNVTTICNRFKRRLTKQQG